MQNEEITEVEETTETAAQGAIDVSENKGLARIEDKVNLPVIPETLNINGVELNIAILTSEIAEVEKMAIAGVTDKEGYDKAVAKLKSISKLRTTSEAWRKKVMAPVLKFGKDLKKPIDEAAELCKKGEKHLEDIIAPIDNYIEEQRLLAEQEKDRVAAVRAEEIVAMGGVLKNGTYNFEHDGGIFILASDLRALNEEDYKKATVDIELAWKEETDRLQAIKDAEEAEQNKLKAQLQDLNAERTEFRKEQLEMKGYALGETINDVWFKGDGEGITEEQILTLDAAGWKALFVPVPVVAPEPEVQQQTSFASIADDFKEPVDIEPERESMTIPSASFGSVIISQPAKETVQVIEPSAIEENVLTRSLVFTKLKPFIQFPFGKLQMRIAIKEKLDVATSDIKGEVETGDINDQLSYVLFE